MTSALISLPDGLVWRGRRRSLSTAGFAVLYSLAAWLGRASRLPDSPLALVWPAAAVAFVWLALSWHDQRRLAVDTAALAASTFLVNVLTGAPLRLAGVFAVANVVLAATTCLVVERAQPQAWRLRRPGDLLALAAASLVGAAVSAAVGPLGIWLTNGGDLPTITAAWVLRNATNTFVFAALALRLLDRGWAPLRLPRARLLEALFAVAAVSVAYLLVFGLERHLPLAFLLLPLSLWLALRFPTTLVAAHVLLAGAFVVVETMAGNGPFAVGAPATRVLLAQAFVAAVGLVALSLALFRDERQRLVDELAAARDEAQSRGALTAAVLDTVGVGVVACDQHGRLSLFNRAARDFHGLAQDPTLASQDWAAHYSLLAEDGTTPLTPQQVPLARVLVEGQVSGAVMVVAPPNRPAVTVRCDGRLLTDSAGRPRGAVVAMTDVTDVLAQAEQLRQARDQALASTRAKTAFLAAASHEIRTPLNGLLGTLELLGTDGNSLTAQQQNLVQIARQSGDALLRLLNDVLDLSKAEATSVLLTRAPFCADDVGADVVAALRPLAEGKDLVLRLHAGAPTVLLGDESRLRQVVMNLVGNALKFTEHGGIALTVTTRREANPGDFVRLSVEVTDTGAGMSPEEMDGLFVPFAQGAQGQRYGGTGLGLALSRQIVEAMGGSIQVASRAGAGSTFTVEVTLPEAPAAVPVKIAAPAADAAPFRRVRVLVADDSDVNLLVASAMLTGEGADVATVSDGQQAVSAVRDGEFDLVLLDNHMPIMSRVDAAQAIRQLPGQRGTARLVALTASAGDAERRSFLEAGMDAVLLKPVTTDDLRRTLAGISGRTL